MSSEMALVAFEDAKEAKTAVRSVVDAFLAHEQAAGSATAQQAVRNRLINNFLIVPIFFPGRMFTIRPRLRGG